MKEPCIFSRNTTEYLERYRVILDEMIEQMTDASLGSSISGNFIVQMIPHHQAAIAMSENLLRYTTCVPLQNIALDIISEQTQSIRDMRQVYRKCCELENTPEDLNAFACTNDRIINTMFHEMKTACADNSIDRDFMREMIPHHMGAVRLSENTLRYPICPELVPILQSIIVSQKRGIRQMTCLLKGR